jgi:putative ATP-binding cassette transporter
MLASGAFMQVQSSLRWFVDNFSTIADWRATLLRVSCFRRAMIDGDAPQKAQSCISMIDGDAGEIRLAELEIATRSGSTRLKEQSVRIKPGERKTLVFRALAGLWPLGAGRIARPQGEPIMYISRTAYLPPGTLREVLTYPSTVEPLSTQAFADALSRLGLARLVPQLDSAQHWDQVLTEDEQQGLVFARVLLRKPPWLLMDEVLDALDKPTLERFHDVFAKGLAHTGFIYIGRENAQEKLFTRVLHLVNHKNDGDSPPA